MSGLLTAVLIHVVIPEVARLLRREPGMTDAEVLAAVEPLAQRVIQTGEAWLASKGVAAPGALPQG